MSRSNHDKPFYVDVGMSIAAIRCASNDDVIDRYDHAAHGKWAIEEANRICDRLNAEVEQSAKSRPKRVPKEATVHEITRELSESPDANWDIAAVAASIQNAADKIRGANLAYVLRVLDMQKELNKAAEERAVLEKLVFKYHAESESYRKSWEEATGSAFAKKLAIAKAERARYRDAMEQFRDIGLRLSNLASSLLSNYEARHRKDMPNMVFVQIQRDFIEKSRAELEEKEDKTNE